MDAGYYSIGRTITLSVCLDEMELADKVSLVEDGLKQVCQAGVLDAGMALLLAEKLEQAAKRLREDAA